MADKNIKIYIIIYSEPRYFLYTDSLNVVNSFNHPNITIYRHPHYLLPNFIWSHHEKIIIIDQYIGFLGGFDLCYGRWDNNKHSIV